LARAWSFAFAKTGVDTFAEPQSAMEIHQRRWLEYDRRSQQTFWPDPKRTQSGDHAMPTPEIGCTLAGPIQNKKLMFHQNGLGDDRTYAARAGNSQYDGREMDQ
jgi:hypothetical protein